MMHPNRSSLRWICGLVLLCTVVASAAALRGQDNPASAKDEAPKPDAAKADAAKADAAQKTAPSGESAPAPPGDPAAAFAARLQQWKDLIKQLRLIHTKYQTADAQEMNKLQVEWNQLVDKGNEMIPELRAAGIAAYKASPNTDRELAGFLVKLAQDDVKRDRYESALKLCSVLVDNETDRSEIYETAGIAAFSLDHFDAAEEYFQKAKDAAALTDEGTKLVEEIPACKQYWEDEQKLRKQEAEANDLPRVKLSTSQGDIVIELFENQAPQTVGNFIHLVEKNFYDGSSFHRVIGNFMAQTGDPEGDGTGGPGYRIKDECSTPDHRNHFRGSVSMANTGEPNSGGSQFFITFRPTPHLNGKHTVFGRVIEGMDVLEKLQRRTPQPVGSLSEPPKPDAILDAAVLRKRDHPYMPTKVEP